MGFELKGRLGLLFELPQLAALCCPVERKK
jgi:hypothetical protein